VSLEDLRAELSRLDGELVQTMARRQALVAEIGALKEGQGRPLRDFQREKLVLDGARAQAVALGLEPALAEEVLRALIRASLERQERARVAGSGAGSGRSALVIGGAGKMGRWFADFLDAQGYAVAVSDPAGAVPPYPSVAWDPEGGAGVGAGGSPPHDLIVVAAPPAASNRILHRLAELRPQGLVFDVGSLKSPLRPGLEALAAAGCRVTSVHPMFGPDLRLLSGRHVLFCDVGHPEATAAARALFEATTAHRIDLSLDDHDRVVAYVLGLSHAVNIAFFTALAASGEAAPLLRTMSSTTFDAQLAVASRVAAENPHLYYEIQALNEHGDAALQGLEEAVATLARRVRARDEAGFVALMEAGRRYLEPRP
jgi:chorismate mutase/prephenate dehydrogenase